MIFSLTMMPCRGKLVYLDGKNSSNSLIQLD